MTFKFLPDVAIADLAFEASSKSLEGLFEEAGKALCTAMVNPKHVKPKIKKVIKLKNKQLDRLFFDWIVELIYLKDADALFFNKFDIKIKKGKEYLLNAIVWGNKIDYEKMELRNDVKAVTMHMFEIKQEKKVWKALVVVDI